jgi:hypothetical protein
MRRNRGAALALAAAIMAIPVGCGGDDENQEHADAAIKICEDYAAERARVEKPLQPLVAEPDSLTPAQVKKVAPTLDEVVVLTRQVSEDLKALPDPESDAAELDKAYQQFEKGLGELEQSAKAARKGDVDGMISAAEAGNKEIIAATDAGDEFGLGACA